MSEFDEIAVPRRKFKISYAILIILLLAATAFVLFRVHVKSKLDKRLDALRQAGFPTTLAELDAWYSIPPGSENAADTLIEAFSRYYEWDSKYLKDLPVAGEAQMPARTEALPKKTKALMADYIADNNDAIKLLHKGAATEHCRYPVKLTLGFNALMPYLSDMRKGARMLEMEAFLAADNNDGPLAVEALKAIFGFSRSLENEPIIVSQLSRIGIDAVGASAVERIVNRTEFTDAQLDEIEQLLAQAEQSEGMKRAIIGERCSMPIMMQNARAADLSAVGSPPLEAPVMGAYRAAGLVQQDALIHIDIMTKYLDAFQLEPYKRQQAAKAIEAQVDNISKIHLLVRILMPGISRIIELDVRHIASLETARVGCAIQRYRLANGKLPDSLENLVPKYLSKVPPDPFDGKELRYKKRDAGYVVYSVGEDGIDDGGLELPPKGKRTGNQNWDVTFIVER